MIKKLISAVDNNNAADSNAALFFIRFIVIPLVLVCVVWLVATVSKVQGTMETVLYRLDHSYTGDKAHEDLALRDATIAAIRGDIGVLTSRVNDLESRRKP